MYNHFLLVGPKSLKINFNNENIYQVLQKIYDNKLTFVSRGDNSGTYKKEISLWKHLGLKINTRKDHWYLETGSGMGPSLNIAVNKNAITLTDTGYVSGSSGTKIFTGSTPLTGTASPQVQVRWKIVGSNQTAENKIHGVSLQWG